MIVVVTVPLPASMKENPAASGRSTARSAPSGAGGEGLVGDVVDGGLHAVGLGRHLERRHRFGQRRVCRLHGGQGEHHGPFRILADGQLGLARQIAGPGLPRLVVGRGALGERKRPEDRGRNQPGAEQPDDGATTSCAGGRLALGVGAAAGRGSRCSSAVSESPACSAHASAMSRRPPAYRKLGSDPAPSQSAVAAASRRRVRRSSRASSIQVRSRGQWSSSASWATSTVGVRLAGSRSKVRRRWRPNSCSRASSSSPRRPSCSSSVRRTRRRVSSWSSLTLTRLRNTRRAWPRSGLVEAAVDRLGPPTEGIAEST